MSDATSIIDIGVNADDFEQFYQLFQQYQAALADMPGEWKLSADQTKQTAANVNEITSALMAQGAIMRDMAKADREHDREMMEAALERANAERAAIVERTEARKREADLIKQQQKEEEEHNAKVKQFWSDSASLTGDIARNTISFTRDIAAFGLKTFAALALGGGAGLFGLDSLANLVTGQRKQALGLGISTAEDQAFGVNFGKQLVGSDFLAQVQSVKSDITQAGLFSQLGLNYQQVQGEDTAHLGIDIIKRAAQLWRSSPASLHTQQGLQQYGLAGFMDFATWQRIGQYSPQQLQSYEAQYNKDVTSFGQSAGDQNAWADFAKSLDRAKYNIETVLVTGLARLTPELSQLTDAFSALIKSVLTDPDFKAGIIDLAGKLKELASFIQTPQFHQDLHQFMDDLHWAASKIGDILRLLGIGAPPAAPPPPIFNAADPSLPKVNSHETTLQHMFGQLLPAGAGLEFNDVANKYDLPPNLFAAVAMQESGMRAHGPDSKAGGQGMFQMMPSYQQQYGVTNPYDPNQEANAFGAGMDNLLKKYHGDLQMALAAYNWGPANLDADIKAHGAGWLSYAPAETQSYVAKIIGEVGDTQINPGTPGSGVPMPASGSKSTGYAGIVNSAVNAANGFNPNIVPDYQPSAPTTVNVNVKVTNQTGAQVAVVANAVRH